MNEEKYNNLIYVINQIITDLKDDNLSPVSKYLMQLVTKGMNKVVLYDEYVALIYHSLCMADLQYLYKLKELIEIDKKVSDFNESGN